MTTCQEETLGFLYLISNESQMTHLLNIQKQKAPRKKPTLQRVFSYDPSAGSPTETLLRLLLPTNKKV